MSTVYEVCLWLVVIGLLATICWQRFGRRIKLYLENRKLKNGRGHTFNLLLPKRLPHPRHLWQEHVQHTRNVK